MTPPPDAPPVYASVESIGAVVLAAGGSTRLGRPKQTLRLGGRSLLARSVAAALDAGCVPVVVVVGRDAEACRGVLAGMADVVVALNMNWEAGQGGSLRVGMRALQEVARVDAAFVLLCDQPHIDAQTLRRLIDARRGESRPVCVAGYAGTLGPPVLVGGTYLDRLRDWPDDRGAKALWTANPGDVTVVPCPEAEADVDTPADYARLQQQSFGKAFTSPGEQG